jgi:hypothetical protein
MVHKKDIGLFKFDPTKRKSMFASVMEILATQGGLGKEWLFSVHIPASLSLLFMLNFP